MVYSLKFLLLLVLYCLPLVSCKENETLSDIPSGNPLIETKVEGLGKVYYGSKLYLKCPISPMERKSSQEEEEEEEDEDGEEDQETKKSSNQPLDGLTWYREDVEIEPSKNESKEVVMRNEWLYLNNENTEALMGTFSCKFKDELKATFYSILALSIHKMETSYTVTEGEDLKLHCKVGKPFPESFTLSWFYKKNLEDPLVSIESIANASTSSEEAHLKILSKDGVPNAMLKIEDAVYEDRAYYYCLGETENEKVYVGTLVRVKDKYAALWPFLGIVAEVIVLCLVILICDKRAAKEKESEEEDETSGMGTGNAGGDSSGLRQRK